MSSLESGDENIGSATKEQEPVSLSGMISTLVPVLILALVYVVIFLILRKSQRRYYAPRTYLGSLRESERTPELPKGYFNWVGAFWKIPDVYALKHQSLDAYLFLRFLRLCATITLVGICITWPILFPINATGGGTQRELDILTYSNVNVTGPWEQKPDGSYGPPSATPNYPPTKNRLYAHVFVAWIFYGFIMYLIMRETIFYINLRQAFLLSPTYSRRISSRTVLFTSVPSPYLDEAKIKKLFSDSVKRVWISGDTTELDKLVEERDKVAMKLEKAEVKLIKLANAERLKAIKKGGSADKTPPTQDTESGTMAGRWIPKNKRPSHRTGALGLIGPKVDTIDWCRTELRRIIPLVEEAQAKYRSGDYKKIPGVFVEFYTQSDAQAAFQVLTHHQALHMTPKYIGIQPGEVIWKSLAMPWWQRVIRRYAVIGFITAMIIFWSIPVGFVGLISQVQALRERFQWLSFLDAVPPQIMGVISGLLPSVLLAVLMSLVPVVMRLCAKLAGEPSNSRVELFTQNAYFCFQLIQVFLVAMLSGSAANAAATIVSNPTSIFGTLSEALPKSSNFYISYFIVQGLTIAAGVLAQIVGFVIFTLMYKFLTSTPRSLYNKWSTLSAISWGSTLPVYTNIAVISITFAIIAPLVLFWATLGLGFFYLAYRYNILFVTDTKVDTRGLIYPRALKHLFSGIYLSEICMIGLFSVSVAIGPLVLMIIFLIFTALFHLTINSALDPLLYSLPRTLEVEEESLLADLEGARGVDPGQEATARNGTKNGGGALGAVKKMMPGSDAVKKIMPGGNDNIVEKKGNLFTRFLKPWYFADYVTLRELVPRDLVKIDEMYSEEVQLDAYYPPTVTSPTPLLWIPEDQAGVSKQEIEHTRRVIPITDEGCTLNEKNKLEWDTEGARPPIWDEKIYY